MWARESESESSKKSAEETHAEMDTVRAELASGDAFRRNGLHNPYKRTDKINYEFGRYDLAFASFKLK